MKLHPCPKCGRGTEAVSRTAKDLLIADLLIAGKAMLESATPSPSQHPSMYAAWQLMRAAIEKAES